MPFQVWDTEKWTLKKTLDDHTDWVKCLVALNRKGDFASGSHDKTIKIWMAGGSYKLKKSLTGHSKSVFTLAVLDNDDLISGSADNTVKV